MNIIYAIYIDSQVDEGPREIVALATSRAHRDHLISQIERYIAVYQKLRAKDRAYKNNRLKVIQDAVEKFKEPIPVSLPYDQKLSKKPTQELIARRKEAIEKADIDLAATLHREICEANDNNTEINLINAGRTAEFRKECYEVNKVRLEYVDSHFTQEEREFEEKVINKLPFNTSSVTYEEIKLNTFFDHPHMNDKFFDMITQVDE